MGYRIKPSYTILASGSLRGRVMIDGQKFSCTKKMEGKRREAVEREIRTELERQYDEYKQCGGVSSEWNTQNWIEYWLTNYKMPKASEMEEEPEKENKGRGGRVTRNTYTRILTSYKQINSYPSGKAILKSRLSEVNTPMVQRLIDDLDNAGLSASSINKVKNLLGAAFDQAGKLDYVKGNPVHYVKCKPVPSDYRKMKEDFIIGAKDYRDFVKEALAVDEKGNPKYMYGAAVALQLLLGCRSGELRALSWNEVDMINREIKIEHSVCEVPELAEDGLRTTGKSEYFLSHGKTVASNRIIPFFEGDHIEECLNILKSRYDVFACQEGYSSRRPLVVGTSTGNYLTSNNYNKEVRRIVKAVFPDKDEIFSSHQLRHSFISMMINDNNQPPADIASIVGHGQLRTTLKYASHTDKEKKRNTIGIISQF